MNLIDLVQGMNWAILPEKLDAIHEVLFRHSHGLKVDPEQFAAAARKTENMYFGRIEGDVAIIPVVGVLGKRMNLFMAFSGGTSMELLGRDIREALEDRDVKAIVLDIDSPGGTVDGTEALADLVIEARKQKPVVAFANGLMASAAYWVGSAADWIITEETADVGSIGVVQIHYDYSRADEREGVKRTLLYSGKYKTIGNNAEPLTREGRDYLQAGLDYVYSIFVEAVASNRGRDVGEVLENMADGRIFIGRQALEAGLVDDMGNFGDAVEIALSMAETRDRQSRKRGGAAPGQKEGTMFKTGKSAGEPPAGMTLEQFEADYPDLAAELRADGAAGVNVQEAVDAERERVLGIADVQFGGEAGQALREIVGSGITVDQFRAARAGAPGGGSSTEQAKEEMLEAIRRAGPENPGTGGAGGEAKVTGANFMEAVAEYSERRKCSKTDAIKAVRAANPAAHQEWLQAQQRTVH